MAFQQSFGIFVCSTASTLSGLDHLSAKSFNALKVVFAGLLGQPTFLKRMHDLTHVIFLIIGQLLGIFEYCFKNFQNLLRIILAFLISELNQIFSCSIDKGFFIFVQQVKIGFRKFLLFFFKAAFKNSSGGNEIQLSLRLHRNWK